MAKSDARGCGLSLATTAYFHMATRTDLLDELGQGRHGWVLAGCSDACAPQRESAEVQFSSGDSSTLAFGLR